jgi:hypothetical protein
MAGSGAEGKNRGKARSKNGRLLLLVFKSFEAGCAGAAPQRASRGRNTIAADHGATGGFWRPQAHGGRGVYARFFKAKKREKKMDLLTWRLTRFDVGLGDTGMGWAPVLKDIARKHVEK